MSDDTNKPADSAAAPSAAPMAKPAAAKARSKPRAPRATKPTAAKAASAKPAARKPAPAAKPVAAKTPVAKPVASKIVATKTPVEKKTAKAKKVKLVRDSFTMPETEYGVIAGLKARCLAAGVSAKKSEILRAAVAGLARLGDTSLVAAIRKLDIIKTGRPAKQGK